MQYDENAEKYGYEDEMTPLKCDELKVYKVYTTRNEGAFGFCEGSDPTDIELEHESVCLKSDVDAAIAELKDAWRSEHEACEALKAKLESVQASAYADSMDAGMRERRLRRALWLARALRARDIQRWWLSATLAPITERACRVWNNIEIKCLKKAEEYK